MVRMKLNHGIESPMPSYFDLGLSDRRDVLDFGLLARTNNSKTNDALLPDFTKIAFESMLGHQFTGSCSWCGDSLGGELNARLGIVGGRFQPRAIDDHERAYRENQRHQNEDQPEPEMKVAHETEHSFTESQSTRPRSALPSHRM